jgi:L-2-hydroxyglutarate oxidase LhgO
MSDSRVVSLSHDLSVTVQQPYEAGQVLSELEAEKLNHLLADNIRTSLNAKIKRIAETAPETLPSLSGEFQTFADSYSFSVKRERAASVDPVTRESHKIAKEKIFAAIRAKGGTPQNYKADEIASLIAKVMSSPKGAEILDEAKRRIDAARKIASDTLDDIFGSDAQVAPAAE